MPDDNEMEATPSNKPDTLATDTMDAPNTATITETGEHGVHTQVADTSGTDEVTEGTNLTGGGDGKIPVPYPIIATPAVPDGAVEQGHKADSDEAKAEPAGDVSLPSKVKIDAPHGFVDEEGVHKFWPVGSVVTDSQEIEDLAKRGVPLTFLYE